MTSLGALSLAMGIAGCGDNGSGGNADANGDEMTSMPLVFDDPDDSPSSTMPEHKTRLRFVDEALERGVDFRHEPHRTPQRYMPEAFSGGVLIVDVNQDGAPDLILLNAGDLRQRERPEASRNRLFLNDGQGAFHDATDAWGLPSRYFGMGGAVGDINNDGWPDVFLTAFDGPGTLLLNTGVGFEEVTVEAGLGEDTGWTTSAGFLDLDNNGLLDLYVVHYIDYTRENAVPCYRGTVIEYCIPVLYDAVPDRVYRNNGDGTFTDISAEVGLPESAGNGLALAVGDVNLDGHVDVYVANDMTRNHLLLNDGQGRFQEIGQRSGVAYSDQGLEEAGMGADFSDVSGNGRLDIVVTNFQGETTSIYQQGEDLYFREISDAIGVGSTARNRLSFGVSFLDGDNDGDQDLAMANGHVQDGVRLFADDVGFAQPNTFYEHMGDGRFVDVTASAGPALEDVQVSRGLAVGDLDGDGRLDYVVANNGGTAQLNMNRTVEPGRFVSLWLEGRQANRSAIGAIVEARVGQRTMIRQVMGATSYQTVSDFRVHLGVGEAEAIDRLVIRWPGGEEQVIEGLPTGAFYHVVEGQAPAPYVPGQFTRTPPAAE